MTMLSVFASLAMLFVLVLSFLRMALGVVLRTHERAQMPGVPLHADRLIASNQAHEVKVFGKLKVGERCGSRR